MKKKIIKTFIPHHTNHHKPHLIRPVGLAVIIAAVILLQMPWGGLSRSNGKVLAYATDITPLELLKDTNAERIKVGMAPLRIDSRLNASAAAKADDMFKYNYWAHVSPSGVQPWFWFKQQQYDFAYAGENLARDFDTSAGVTLGWMNSPSHRENLLNPHYVDIGLAVVNGTMLGHQTTLVVAHYGTRVPVQAIAAVVPNLPTPPIKNQTAAQTPPTEVKPQIISVTKAAAIDHPANYSIAHPLPVSQTLADNGKISLLLLIIVLATMLWSHGTVWRRRLLHGYTHGYRLRAASELSLVGIGTVIIIVRSFGSVI